MPKRRRASPGIVAILISVISVSPCFGAEFRGSSLGGPCSSVAQRELALGSKQLGKSGQAGQFKFSGTAFNRAAQISYSCKDGVLSLVDIRPSTQKDDAAPANFEAFYDGLNALYGATYAEIADPAISANKSHPRAGDTPIEYNAIWQGTGYHVTLTMHALQGSSWIVFAVITPAGK